MDNIKQISVRELQKAISEHMALVYYQRQPVAVARNGKVMAVMIHPEAFEQFRAWQARQGGEAA